MPDDAGDRTRVSPLAEEVVARLRDHGLTVGVGESLTAGLVCSMLAEVPGCSDVLRGGVVAYHPDLKRALLRVPDAALGHGVVSEDVAVYMARGARDALRADVGVATTGVAGPQAHDGAPVGRVWIAVVVPSRAASAASPVSADLRTVARRLDLEGDRGLIRARSTQAALALLLEALDHAPRGDSVAGE